MLVKKIEVKLNKTQQNQFFVDQNNLRFIHNFYLSYQDLNYEQYRLGNSNLKYIFGKTLFLANTFYPSSKTCSNCGSLKKDLKLSDRIYKCTNCNQEIDRDLNASINLSYIGGYAENLSLV